MLSLKRKKNGVLFSVITLLVVGGTIFATNTSNTFADTPKDNGIENYTFTETPADTQKIPVEEGISAVTIKADSIVVEYNTGDVKEFSNSDYYLDIQAAE